MLLVRQALIDNQPEQLGDVPQTWADVAKAETSQLQPKDTI